MALVATLNGMDCSGCEVVVAPSALHLPLVVSSVKKDIAVAAQNCNFKVPPFCLCKRGAAAGRVRYSYFFC
jgi:hypothetical protein